jgi:hypothetical protein
MKRAILGAVTLALAWTGWANWASTAWASDPAGVYARIDRISLEPNDQNPERIKIWGAFCLAAGRGDSYRDPECGYLYFQIMPGQERQCRAEWADFERVAGKGQCVAFGNRYGNKFTIRTVSLSASKSSANEKDIARWVADLDSNQFATREKATHELEKLGEAAQPALRKALEDNPKPEARKRLERLTESGRADPYPLGVGVMKIASGTNVDTDYPPIRALLDMPVATSPDDGCLVPVGDVTLIARNIHDAHHSGAQYVFEIEDAAGVKEVSKPISAGEKETKWSPRMQGKAGQRYAWRVRAVQGDWKGPVTRAVFIVKG